MEYNKIPELTNIRQGYDNKDIALTIDIQGLLTFPRDTRKALLANEVERMLLMLDWEEQRKEVDDYVQGKED